MVGVGLKLSFGVNIVNAYLVAFEEKVVEVFKAAVSATHLLEYRDYFRSDLQHVLASEEHLPHS